MLYYSYNNMGDLIGFKYNDNSYYYIKNIQDDIIGILDSNYNIVAKYTYDSWGNIISITDGNNNDVSLNNTHIANINPFRYRSYYYDKETKLYYLNSRYYNPLWGRFINADNVLIPTGNTLSNDLFAYVENNPISKTDSSGHFFGLDVLISGFVGSIANIASQFIADATTSIINKKPSFSSWQTYAGSAAGGFLGGVTTRLSGPKTGVLVASSSSTAIAQTLENVTGKEKRSAERIIGNTVSDTLLGVVSDKLSLKVRGITSGRNSYNSIYKSGLTKIKNEYASRMSSSVFKKGVTSETVSGIPGSISSGVKSYFEDINTYNNLKYCTIEW